MSNKQEIAEQSTLGLLGLGLFTLPNLESASQFFVGVTPIASFFLILIPTGIWAWIRAVQSLTNKDEE